MSLTHNIWHAERNIISETIHIPTLISFGSNLGGISWMALDDLARRTTRKFHHHDTSSLRKQRKERSLPVSQCHCPK